MKRTTQAVLAMIVTGAICAQASVVIGWGNNSDDTSRIIEVVSGGAGTTNITFNDTGPNSQSADWANLSTVSDTWTAGVSGDKFQWSLTTAVNWNDSLASDAAALNTWLSSGVAPAVLINNAGFGAGVNSGTLINALGDNTPDRLSQYGEALIMTIDSLSLSAGNTAILDGVANFAANNSDYGTFLYFDSSAGTILSASVNVQNPDGLTNLGIEMGAGDAFIVASGASTDALNPGWRLGSMTVDVIPEPATLGLITASGLGLLWIRRRFTL